MTVTDTLRPPLPLALLLEDCGTAFALDVAAVVKAAVGASYEHV